MALKISINTDYGVPAEYWKITQFNTNTWRGETHVVLEGWTTEQARADRVNPIASRAFDFPPEVAEFGHDVNNFAVAYAAIKVAEGGEFAQAEDV